MAEKKLTPKQRKFVSGVLKGKSKTQAAIDAGYSKKSVATNTDKITKNYEVSKAIEEGQKQRSKRLELEEDYELKNFISIFDVSCQNFVDDKGAYNTGAVTNAINAMDKIVKMRGKYNTKLDIDIKGDLATLIGRLKDD